MLPFIKCLFLLSLFLCGLAWRPTDDVDGSRQISLVSDATAHLQAVGTALAQTNESAGTRAELERRAVIGNSSSLTANSQDGDPDLFDALLFAMILNSTTPSYSSSSSSSKPKQEKEYYLPKVLMDKNRGAIPVLTPASDDGRWWRADKSVIGGTTPGLAYRKKMDLNAKKKYILNWGKTVLGRDLGNWVAVKKSKAKMKNGEKPYGVSQTQSQTGKEQVFYLPKTLTFNSSGPKTVLFPASNDGKWWRAENSILKHATAEGLGYRTKMQQNAPKAYILHWGKTIQGRDLGNWVEVEKSKAMKPNGEQLPEGVPSHRVQLGAGFVDDTADLGEMISPPPDVQISGDASYGEDLRGVIDAYGVAWAVKLDKSFMRRMKNTSLMPFKNNSKSRNGGGVESSKDDLDYVKANIYLDLKLLKFYPQARFPAPIVWSKIDKKAPMQLLQTGFQTRVKLKGWWQDQLKHFRGKGMVRNRNKNDKNWVAWAFVPWSMVDIQFDRDGARFYVEWIPGNGAWFSFRRNYNSKKKKTMTFRLDARPDVEPKELRSIYKSGPLSFPVADNSEMLVMTMKPYEWKKDRSKPASSGLRHYRASIDMGFMGLKDRAGNDAKNRTWKQAIPGSTQPWFQHVFEQGVWRCALRINNKTIQQSGYLQYQAMVTSTSCLPGYSNRTDTACPWLQPIWPEYDLKLLGRQIVMRQSNPLSLTGARLFGSGVIAYSLYPIYDDDWMQNWRQQDNVNPNLWVNFGGTSVDELLGDALNNTDEHGAVHGQPIGNSSKADEEQALQKLRNDLYKANESINYYKIKNEELQIYNEGLEADILRKKENLAAQHLADYGPGSPYKIALDRKNAAEKELSELKKQEAQWMGLCPGWEMNTTNGRPYFYNRATGKSSWTKPDCGSSSSHVHPYVANSISSSRQTVLCPGWQMNLTNGREYYFNRATGETSWTKPTCSMSSPQLHPSVENTVSSSSQSGLCPGWEMNFSSATGQVVYFNHATGQTSWTKPICDTSSSQLHPSVANSVASSSQSVLCPGWQMNLSRGNILYFNQATGETSWTKPTCNTSSPQMANFSHPAGQNYAAPNFSVHPATVQNNSALRPATAPIVSSTTPEKQNNTALRTAAAAAVPDCPGWQSTMDMSGRVYYFNKATNENTWVKPACASDVDPNSDELFLCPGWKMELSNGKPYYYNVASRETTWTKPVCTRPSYHG